MSLKNKLKSLLRSLSKANKSHNATPKKASDTEELIINDNADFSEQLSFDQFDKEVEKTSLPIVKAKNKLKLTAPKAIVSENSAQLIKPKIIKKPTRSLPKLKINPVQKRKQQLVIGLDFGTAYTKVVIGESRYAYAVPLNGNDFIIPCKVYTDGVNNCSLTRSLKNKCFDELKLKLLLGNANKSDLAIVASYIALILQRSRGWLLKEKKNLYGNYDIDWLVNVGLPAASYDNHKLNKQYLAIIQTAWELSFGKKVNLEFSEQLIDVYLEDNTQRLNGDISALDPKFIHPDNIGLFPEFLAQIAGYVKSPSRRKFAHCLVDVGAGTLDVAVFIVKEVDGLLTYPTYGKQVKNLGTDLLAKHRIKVSRKSLNIDVQERFPSDKEFADKLNLTINDLLQTDKTFSDDVYKTIGQALTDTNRYESGGRFVEPITTFFCGGGSNVEMYKRVIQKQIRQNTFFPLQVVMLKKPERLVSKGITENQYHRLSVAYGLSYDPLELGEAYSITLPEPPDPKSPTQGNGRTMYHNPSSYTLYS